MVDLSDRTSPPAAIRRFSVEGPLIDFPRGTLVSGTGGGASIAANQLPGIRASICRDEPESCGRAPWADRRAVQGFARLGRHALPLHGRFGDR